MGAAVYSKLKLLETWTEKAIDHVVKYGDDLYFKSLESGVIPDCGSLLISQLPVVSETLDGRTVSLKYGHVFQGRTDFSFNTPPYYNLEDSLVNAFSLSDNALLVLKGYTMCMFKCEKNFCLFDSHSRNADGLQTATGPAVLLRFDNFSQVENHIHSLAAELHVECIKIVCLELSVMNNLIKSSFALQIDTSLLLKSGESSSHMYSGK